MDNNIMHVTKDMVYLKKLIPGITKNCDRLLDVGSGDGRLFNYLKSAGRAISMCDISKVFIDKCHKNTGVRPEWWDGRVLPYKDNDFKIVIAFQVALHVPPDNIADFLSELVRVSGEYLYIVTYYSDPPATMAEHCFMHNYYELFTRLRLGVVSEKYHRACNPNWLLRKQGLAVPRI